MAENSSEDGWETPPSHYVARSVTGRIITWSFLGLFVFTQPPLVFLIGNRIEPSFSGIPFLYLYLLVLYCLLLVVLLAAQRRGL